MPDTFQALSVLILALLPGALYVWAFERYAGAWGVRLSDRLFRFIGFSALMHVLLAPVTYRLWVDFVRSGRLAAGAVPIAIWFVPIAFVVIPMLAGSVIGRATRQRKTWATLFTGPDPAPRAWDHLFGSGPDGWIRLRLKSGRWIGGAFARQPDGSRSYAAGYPEDQDLYLLEAVEVDPDTGSFILGEDGAAVSRGSSILVRWEEVEYLDFIEA